MSTKTTQFELPRKRFLILLAVVIVFFVLGQYHIVLDAPGVFVRRPYFGFSDIIAGVGKCTSGGRLITKNRYPSLCTALQDAGLIESDDSWKDRTTKELQSDLTEKYKDIEKCVSNCKSGNSDYASCISSCY